MKECGASICLMVAAVVLLSFVYTACGQPAESLVYGRSMPQETANIGGLSSASETPDVELMTPAGEAQRVSSAYVRCFYLLLALLVRRALWKKPRFIAVTYDKNKRFAVESKTSHPQQAPPFFRQLIA